MKKQKTHANKIKRIFSEKISIKYIPSLYSQPILHLILTIIIILELHCAIISQFALIENTWCITLNRLGSWFIKQFGLTPYRFIDLYINRRLVPLEVRLRFKLRIFQNRLWLISCTTLLISHRGRICPSSNIIFIIIVVILVTIVFIIIIITLFSLLLSNDSLIDDLCLWLSRAWLIKIYMVAKSWRVHDGSTYLALIIISKRGRVSPTSYLISFFVTIVFIITVFYFLLRFLCFLVLEHSLSPGSPNLSLALFTIIIIIFITGILLFDDNVVLYDLCSSGLVSIWSFCGLL